jgi:CRISPR-associated protein Csb2
MLTLKLNFPWGRYYAHPWGQNPQRLREAEWPPSPWRLMRAIAAGWFRLHAGQPASPELLDLLTALGRELPEIQLPKVAFSKTVHYQPNYGVTDKEDQGRALYKRVRHENHFVAVAGPVRFHYSLLTVPEAERVQKAETFRQLLAELTPAVQYFGRAESLCEFTVGVVENFENSDKLARVALDKDGRPSRRIAEDCREVFCPNPGNFQAEDLWQPRNVASAAGALPHLVEDLFAASQPLPDGARWFSYQMPEGWPQRWIVRHPSVVREKPKTATGPIVARYLRFSLQCRIGIPHKFVVSLAEQFRNQAIRRHGDATFALSGHKPPQNVSGDHQHAFYLPQPGTNDEYLTELRVWCRYGFTQREMEALMRVDALRWADGRYPARPVLLEVQRELPIVPPSQVWRSVTPFVPPRFWYRQKVRDQKLKRGDTPEAQLARCLRDAGVIVEGSVRRIETERQWEVCKVHLPKHDSTSEPDQRIGVFLEVRFATPTDLPFLAFGHSCHFGLGLFVPFSTA